MQHIPYYSIILFGVLVYLGIKRCYARTIRPARLFLFPVAMAVFGAPSLTKLFPAAAWQEFGALLVAVLVGAMLGWTHASRWQLEFDVSRGKVHVPGDPALLALIIATYLVEFLVHYEVESRGTWANSELFLLFSFCAWGLLLGMSAGRALNVLVRYCKSEAAFASN